MKRSLNILKYVMLFALVVFLYGFSNTRNENRKLTEIDIKFVDESSPFITLTTVNKLLIQNQANVTGIHKETLVLNEMESRLRANPMIRNAEVYVGVEGELGARIEQRKPLGRVAAAPDYYIDSDGKAMPLSSVYTARVPLITGTSSKDFVEVTPLLLKIEEDNFMNSLIIGLHVKKDGNINLKVRKYDFTVLFGKPENIDKKFQHFKAFYQKTTKDSTLYSYTLVNVQFESQVVATKKE